MLLQFKLSICSSRQGEGGAFEGTGGVEIIKMMFLVWISRNFLQLFYPQCWISVSSCQLLALLTVVWHYHSQLVWIAFCKGCHGMLLCSGMVILCWPGTIPISFYPILIYCNTIWFLGKRVLFNMSDGRILLVRKEWISALKLCAELEKDFFFYIIGWDSVVMGILWKVGSKSILE